jgi:hypothetical protein
MKTPLTFFFGGVAGIALTIAVLAVYFPASQFHTYSKRCIISDVDPANWEVFCPN